MSREIVLTGFEPFGDFQVNPSWEAAKTFENKRIGSFNIKSFKIPLVYKKIKPAITKIIDAENPAIIISLGQSCRSAISLEKVALNFADLSDATVLYNCGTRPRDEILELNAPKAYFTGLPIRKILNRLQEHGISAEISYTAGTFGCNQLFHTTMHKIRSEGLNTYAGFIHVPSLPSQAAKLQREKNLKIPSMDSETVVKAIEIAINVSIEEIS